MKDNLSSDAALGAMLNLPAMLIGSALGGIASAVSRATRQGGGRVGSGRKSHGKGTWVATTDIKWKANEGDTRVASLLIENNRAQDANITVTSQPWTDGAGNQVTGGGLVLSPTAFILKPGASEPVKAQVTVAAPLQPGMAYYTEITIGGGSRKTILVGGGGAPAW